MSCVGPTPDRVVNQHLRVRRLTQLGLYSEIDYRGNLEQLAGFLSTPGGKLFVESNRIFPSYLLEAMKPYLDRESNSDFILGRDPLQLE